jgi:hypothetical protein
MRHYLKSSLVPQPRMGIKEYDCERSPRFHPGNLWRPPLNRSSRYITVFPSGFPNTPYKTYRTDYLNPCTGLLHVLPPNRSSDRASNYS